MWPTPYRGGAFATPWDLMRNFSEEIDRLWENVAGLRSGSTPFGLTRAPLGGRDFPSVWSPQIEVQQKANAVVFQADLPGLKPDEIDVSVDNGVLTISGERTQEQKEEREGYWRSERSYGSFYRAIPLPDGVDEDKIAASFKNGVLEVNVPLTGRSGGKKIKVEG